jgi:hypothetical protein
MSYRLRIEVLSLREEIGDNIEQTFTTLSEAVAAAERYETRVWVIKDDRIVAVRRGKLGWVVTHGWLV